MRLNDRVALITGGTSGIGEATALLLAKEGAEVAITGRNRERGAAVVQRIKDIGPDAVFLHADVSVAGDCRRREFSIPTRRWNVRRKSGTNRSTLT